MKNKLIVAMMLMTYPIFGQLDITYQTPPKEILDLADAPLPPLMRMNSSGEQAILVYRKPFKSLEELSREEMRLAGLRIDPKTNISSRERYYYDIQLLDPQTGQQKQIQGLPENGRFSNFDWSYDE